MSRSSFSSPNSSTNYNQTNRALTIHSPRRILTSMQTRYIQQEQTAAFEQKGSYQAI